MARRTVDVEIRPDAFSERRIRIDRGKAVGRHGIPHERDQQFGGELPDLQPQRASGRGGVAGHAVARARQDPRLAIDGLGARPLDERGVGCLRVPSPGVAGPPIVIVMDEQARLDGPVGGVEERLDQHGTDGEVEVALGSDGRTRALGKCNEPLLVGAVGPEGMVDVVGDRARAGAT